MVNIILYIPQKELYIQMMIIIITIINIYIINITII